jgi:tetratricopeptide (TPR) repeat protein
VLGVGAGNWQIDFPDQALSGLWRAEDLNFTFQRPHNDFLWILSETGIIGFNLFLLFIFSILLLLSKTLKTDAVNKSESNDVIMCFAFIIGYFAISFFDFPKERIEHTVWINIILGLSYYNIKNYNSLRPLSHFSIRRSACGFSFVLLAFIVIVGILRYKGEFYTRKMYDYKYSGQNLKLIAAGNEALSFAYTFDPTSVPVNWFTGNARNALGDYKNAHKDFMTAYDFNPYNRNVVNDLASSCALCEDLDHAKKYYLEASRISPRFDDPKLNLAAIYINEKNYKKAGECLGSLFHDSERRANYQKIVDAFKTEQ